MCFGTFSSPRDGLLVMCERTARSVYIDRDPFLADGLIPEPMEDMDVSLPSESYLQKTKKTLIQ